MHCVMSFEIGMDEIWFFMTRFGTKQHPPHEIEYPDFIIFVHFWYKIFNEFNTSESGLAIL